MNFYCNCSGSLSTIKSHKVCSANENDFNYLIEYHIGYTRWGPLSFGRGCCPRIACRKSAEVRSSLYESTGHEHRVSEENSGRPQPLGGRESYLMTNPKRLP